MGGVIEVSQGSEANTIGIQLGRNGSICATDSTGGKTRSVVKIGLDWLSTGED
jgi:hypothetical protein